MSCIFKFIYFVCLQFYSTKLLGTGNDLTGKWEWWQDGDARNAMLNVTFT